MQYVGVQHSEINSIAKVKWGDSKEIPVRERDIMNNNQPLLTYQQLASTEKNGIPNSILVVDDDEGTRELLRMGLEKRGFQMILAKNGIEAMRLIEDEAPDLIILDLMMPHVDGLQVCQRVRANYDTPIIVLSAIGLEETIVKALDLGADDYLIKPFGFEELTARIHAVARRSEFSSSQDDSQIQIGGLIAHPSAKSVTINEQKINFTPTEFNLLTELLLHVNEVIPHNILLERVWGKSYTESVEYLHIYIGRLRDKLANTEEVKIKTYPGTGYMLKSLA